MIDFSTPKSKVNGIARSTWDLLHCGTWSNFVCRAGWMVQGTDVKLVRVCMCPTVYRLAQPSCLPWAVRCLHREGEWIYLTCENFHGPKALNRSKCVYSDEGLIKWITVVRHCLPCFALLQSVAARPKGNLSILRSRRRKRND